jgi:hypothetical protein
MLIEATLFVPNFRQEANKPMDQNDREETSQRVFGNVDGLSESQRTAV